MTNTHYPSQPAQPSSACPPPQPPKKKTVWPWLLIPAVERIVTDNGACYTARDFAKVLLGARHQRITLYTPRHNGKVERYNRILAEEFLYAREWASDLQRRQKGAAARSGDSGYAA